MKKDPHIILCSGQSNMARVNRAISWPAPANLKVWDYSVKRDGENVGNGFVDPDTETVNYGTLYGAEIANSDLSKQVYVINISRGATNLGQWLKAAPHTNMWNAIANNMPAALTQIVEKCSIDELIWWGHESDASVKAATSATQFRDDFLSVINQINSETWGNNGNYKILLHKIYPECNGLAEQINFGLELICRELPGQARLGDTTAFRYSDKIHLDGEEKEKAAHAVFNSKGPGYSLADITPRHNFIINGAFLSNKGRYKGTLLSKGDIAHDVWIAAVKDARYSIDDGVVKLAPGSSISQPIFGRDLLGSVLTLSAEHVSHNLIFKINDQQAIMTAGNGRRQASIKSVKIASGKTTVTISNINNHSATLSKIKLEKSGRYTEFKDLDRVNECIRCWQRRRKDSRSLVQDIGWILYITTQYLAWRVLVPICSLLNFR